MHIQCSDPTHFLIMLFERNSTNNCPKMMNGKYSNTYTQHTLHGKIHGKTVAWFLKLVLQTVKAEHRTWTDYGLWKYCEIFLSESTLSVELWPASLENVNSEYHPMHAFSALKPMHGISFSSISDIHQKNEKKNYISMMNFSDWIFQLH